MDLLQQPLVTGCCRPAARLERLCDTLEAAAEAADSAGHVDPSTWASVRSSGLLLAAFPKSLGGEDLLVPERALDLLTVLRRLGGADLSMARLIEGHMNAVALVCRYGTCSQLQTLSDAAKAGAFSGVWGADDAAGLSIERSGSGWRLQGRKILASGAGFLVRPVVTAKCDGEQVMILPRLEPGERADVSGWSAQGMRSTATGAVDLTDMVIGDDQILGRPGDFMRQPHFSGGAWRFCAVHLGAMERLVDLFRDHLVSRRRDGDPFQLQRIAECVTATTSASYWIADAARRDAARRIADESADASETVAFVNMTRGVTERAALDVLEAVHRGVGLGAFVRPHPIERMSRDLSTYLRQPVPDLAMTDAARAVLASPRPTADLWRTGNDR